MLRVRSHILSTAFILAALGSTAGCSDDPAGSNSSQLSILLTDAPGDLKTAVVTISQIYLQGSEKEESSRVVLSNTVTTTDLLTLTNSTTTLVQDAVVPAGSYSQLRFVITGGYVEVENSDGSTSIYASSPSYEGLPAGAQVAGTLQMPSFAQTGIKVNLPGGAVSITGEQKVLLVDFDVSQSFGQQAGQSGRWVMTPVLEATDFSATGSVTATLRADASLTMPMVNGAQVTLGQFRAVLTNAARSSEELALSDSDNDGVYEARFRYLVAGDFTVDFIAPDGVTFTTDRSRPASVSVPSGQDVAAGFTVMTAASAAR